MGDRLVCADIDGSGTVGSADLGILLGDWGTCPVCDSYSAAYFGPSAAYLLAVEYEFDDVWQFASWLGEMSAYERAVILLPLEE